MSAGQEVLQVGELPEVPLEAAAHFFETYLAQARQILADGATSLVIALPTALQDHDDWRRALARDLARAHAPARVNVVAGNNGACLADMISYLGSSPGVTGQYIPSHV